MKDKPLPVKTRVHFETITQQASENGCADDHPEHKNVLQRLKRIEGQVKGIQKMVSDNKYCIDIITQISAVRAALKSTGMVILKRHIETCVSNAIRTGNAEQNHIIEELIQMLSREDI